MESVKVIGRIFLTYDSVLPPAISFYTEKTKKVLYHYWDTKRDYHSLCSYRASRSRQSCSSSVNEVIVFCAWASNALRTVTSSLESTDVLVVVAALGVVSGSTNLEVISLVSVFSVLRVLLINILEDCSVLTSSVPQSLALPNRTILCKHAQ